MQTTVKRTGLGHGESGTCRYIGDDKKQAHNLAQLRKRYADDPRMLKYINQHDTKRNIALAGIGVRTCGWKYTARDFHRLSHLKLHNKVKTINIIISPQRGTINPHNLEQVEQFKRFCIRYGKIVFPHHKIYIAIQHDNKGGKRSRGGITHAHLIVSSLSTLPPHNALKGTQYDNYHLRREYNKLAQKFDQKQDVIKLGQAIYTKHNRAPKPNATETWLAERSQKPLDELEAGQLPNITAVKRAFKKSGIMLKITKHKTLMHATDKDGTLIYHTDRKGHKHKIVLYCKYTSGKRKGQYMYRKNRHGNKSKVAQYSYTYGMTLKPIKKKDKRSARKRRYIRASRMERITGDKRLRATWIATVLYQIKKGTYQIPEKYQQQPKPQPSSVASKIVSKASEASSSSSIPTRSRLASEAVNQRIRPTEADDEPTPSAPKPSDSSFASAMKSSESVSAVQSKSNARASEAQQSAEAQRQQQLLTKSAKAKKAERQRKEKTDHERRITEQFEEMAEINQQQRQRITRQSEEAEPTSRPYATADKRPADEPKQRRTNAGRQEKTGRLGRFINNLRRENRRTKQVYIKAKLTQVKHRIAKFINDRIQEIKKRITIIKRKIWHRVHTPKQPTQSHKQKGPEL